MPTLEELEACMAALQGMSLANDSLRIKAETGDSPAPLSSPLSPHPAASLRHLRDEDEVQRAQVKKEVASLTSRQDEVQHAQVKGEAASPTSRPADVERHMYKLESGVSLRPSTPPISLPSPHSLPPTHVQVNTHPLLPSLYPDTLFQAHGDPNISPGCYFHTESDAAYAKDTHLDLTTIVNSHFNDDNGRNEGYYPVNVALVIADSLDTAGSPNKDQGWLTAGCITAKPNLATGYYFYSDADRTAAQVDGQDHGQYADPEAIYNRKFGVQKSGGPEPGLLGIKLVWLYIDKRASE